MLTLHNIMGALGFNAMIQPRFAQRQRNGRDNIGKIQYTGASFNLKGRMDAPSLWSRELQAAELVCLPSEVIDSTAS